MAEAIAAFSLAANVLQFLDVGGRIISSIWSFYKSNRKDIEQAPDLITISKDLQRVLGGFQLPEEGVQADDGLVQLSRQCLKVAKEMQDLLASVFKNGAANMGKREAVLTALKMVWKEDKIRSLEDRLDRFRQQLVLHVLASLREQAHKSIVQQQDIFETLQQVREGALRLKGTVEKLSTDEHGLGSLLLDFLVSKADLVDREREKYRFRYELIRQIFTKSDPRLDRNHLSQFISEPRQEYLHKKFLARIRYQGMEDREMRVAKAHESTFRWIFEDSSDEQRRWSNFKKWLTSESQLYWITGKAGSGKSTLMKYICQAKEQDQEELRFTTLLNVWSKGNKLLLAVFFFWNPGIALQMTQAGLLRTLLAQIVETAPDLLPTIFPSRWEMLFHFDEVFGDWKEYELRHVMRLVATKLGEHTKLCLFVDGLDEFDGDHSELISLFQDLLVNPAIKLCVASRPWVVFEDAFAQAPSLMLQDFTYPDIKNYVASRFYTDPSFALLRQRDQSYAERLVEKVVVKSSGVFLWVRLVVQSLLSGLGHGDRISDLERRLDLLPPDLEDLYDKILASLDPFYLEHAAHYFKMVEESEVPPEVLLLAYVDEAEDFEKVIDLQIGEPPIEEIAVLYETMRRRVNSRCRGFLEVPYLHHQAGDVLDDAAKYQMKTGTVQYLHRTVKDYVKSQQVQQKLQSAMVQPFDHDFNFCVGHLAILKTMSQSTLHLDLQDPEAMVWTHTTGIMKRARKVSPPLRGHLMALLDDLDKTGSILAKIGSLEDTNGIPDFRLKLVQSGQWVGMHPFRALAPLFGGHFLSLAVCYDIGDYIAMKANKGCLVQTIDRNTWSAVHPLLLDSLCFDETALDLHGLPESNIATLEVLLEKGADPNAGFRKSMKVSTVWETAKTCLQDYNGVWLSESRLLVRLQRYSLVFALLVRYGAGDYTNDRRELIQQWCEDVHDALERGEVPTGIHELYTLLGIERRQ